MPAISMFYGLIVYMYFMDNKQHKMPHIHVKYQEHEVVVSIPDGEVLDGSIPISKMKLLQAWIELHKDELIADWELAVSGQHPYKIEPLR
jgi:shikimate kinase